MLNLSHTELQIFSTSNYLSVYLQKKIYLHTNLTVLGIFNKYELMLLHVLISLIMLQLNLL